MERWSLPPPSVIKFNCDGAFKSSRSLAAFGILPRDSGGSAQVWWCGKTIVSSTLSIEAWALRIACMVAVEKNFHNVVFESDCKNLVSNITKHNSQCPWKIEAIVQDIKGWAKERQWSFVWYNRYKTKQHTR